MRQGCCSLVTLIFALFSFVSNALFVSTKMMEIDYFDYLLMNGSLTFL